MLSTTLTRCAVRLQRGGAERADGVQRRQRRLDQVRGVPRQLQLVRAVVGAAGARQQLSVGSVMGLRERLRVGMLQSRLAVMAIR